MLFLDLNKAFDKVVKIKRPMKLFKKTYQGPTRKNDCCFLVCSVIKVFVTWLYYGKFWNFFSFWRPPGIPAEMPPLDGGNR